MNSNVTLITPAVAEAYLQNNRNNRNLRQSNIDALARSMSSGTFYANGEPIIFDASGMLVDGQHRLHAIIKSGVPQEMVVITGIPVEQAKNYDMGVPRSIADQMFFLGEPIPHRNNIVIAAVSFILRRQTKESSRRITVDELKTFYNNHDAAIDFVYKNYCTGGTVAATRQAAVAAAIIAAHESKYNLEKLQRFCHVILTGESTSDKEFPIIKLRDYMRSVPTRGGVAMKDKYERTQYALHQYQTGNASALCRAAKKEYYPTDNL